MAEYLPHPYAYYATRASSDLPQTASEMAGPFHEVWWTDESFAGSREEFGDRLSTISGPLKAEIARYARGAVADLPPHGGPHRSELDLLAKAVVAGPPYPPLRDPRRTRSSRASALSAPIA